MRLCFKLLWTFLIATGLSCFFAETTEAGLLDIPLEEIVESTVSTVEDTVEAESILAPEDGLLSEKGLAETIQSISDIVDSTLEAVPETVETVVQGVEDIVENVEPALSEIVEAVNDVADSANELVTDLLDQKADEEANEEDPPIVIPVNPIHQQFSADNSREEINVATEGTFADAIEDEDAQVVAHSDVNPLNDIIPESQSNSILADFPEVFVEQAPIMPLPVQKEENSSVPPVIVTASWSVTNRSISNGSCTHSQLDYSDWMLADQVYYKLEGRRHFIRHSSLPVTQWANAPPTQPPMTSISHI